MLINVPFLVLSGVYELTTFGQSSIHRGLSLFIGDINDVPRSMLSFSSEFYRLGYAWLDKFVVKENTRKIVETGIKEIDRNGKERNGGVAVKW